MHPLTFIYLWYLCIYYIWYIETIFVQTKKARKKINQKPPNWKRSQRSVHPCSRSRGRRGWWNLSMAPPKNPCPSRGLQDNFEDTTDGPNARSKARSSGLINWMIPSHSFFGLGKQPVWRLHTAPEASVRLIWDPRGNSRYKILG